MKKQITLMFMLLSIVTYSQKKYEKGYFISNDGTKTDCLIKNEDWNNNPSSFIYKLNDDSDQISNQISEVREFEIYNKSKFERHQIKVDISSDNLQNLSKQRNPDWEVKTLFLKHIVKGDANLYSYRKNSKNLFFYNKTGEQIEQLIYKKYELKSEKVALNLSYLNQLYKFVNCEKNSIEKIKTLAYNNKELINYFNRHNICVNPKSNKNNVSNTSKSEFKFKINLGLNNSSYNFGNTNWSDEYTVDFGSNQSFRIGFETEVILPFNNHKWSLFIEPAYAYFKENVENEFSYGGSTNPKTGTVEAFADLKMIEISLGGRNYFYAPNKQTKLFADFGFIWSSFFNSNVEYVVIPEEFQQPKLDDFFVSINFFGGIGVLLKNKIIIEAKIQSRKEVVVQNTGWKSDLNTFSIILGYVFN